MKEKELVSNEYLTKKILSKFLMPSIFALLASNLSSMVGTVILGNDMGGQGLAAMSLVAPVSLVYFTIGSMIAVGASIMASISLGGNDKEKAESFFASTFLLAAVIGMIMTVVGLGCLDTIVKILGAKGDLVPLVKEYCRFYIGGGMATLVFYIPFNFLKIMGRPHVSMILLIVMGAINIGLTLLFVTHLHMSTGGVALATVIGIAGAFLLGCGFMFSGKVSLRPHFRGLNRQEIFSIFSAGSAAALNNLSRALTVILLNYVIARVGTEITLTIYTVSRSINELLLTVVLGVSQSVVPLVSLFYGEKDNESIRRVMKTAFKIGISMITVCTIFAVVFAKSLISLYGVKDIAGLGMGGIVAIVCVAVSQNISFMNNLFSNYYSATKRSGMSNTILFFKTVFVVGLAYLLGIIFSATAIWGCFILSEVFTLAVWYGRSRYIFKKNKQATELWLLPLENEDTNKNFSFSVKNCEESILFASEKITDFCETSELTPKQTMLVSLAIEEILMMIVKKCWSAAGEEFIDIRIFLAQEGITIRIRNGGARFNPIQYYREQEEEFSDAMGIGIVMKTAKVIDYIEVLGVNNLLIVI